ncbi:MAG: hypothetical protein IT342_07495 [Candidatus Melainabacteria bacterium]|nr:hypothetical protein [Candidatus Melainabacteria bacterium]
MTSSTAPESNEKQAAPVDGLIEKRTFSSFAVFRQHVGGSPLKHEVKVNSENGDRCE